MQYKSVQFIFPQILPIFFCKIRFGRRKNIQLYDY
jgi:hypothetical protein